ncbi:MAG: methyltransferase domain-containing protein [Proteobacteria bacterium]|nr:methyltransferase domain-containing protein [Pseudomonadota bacterium]
MMSVLMCPQCRGTVAREGDSIRCRSCGASYPVLGDVPQFDLPKTEAALNTTDVGGDRDHRRTFWDHGWEARFQSGDHAFLNNLKSRADWDAYFEREIPHLRSEGHVSVIEAGGPAIRDKIVLDIGCGAGAVGAMFGHSGARYIGIDHSRHAAMYTLRHLRAAGGDGFTAQGNAETLPLLDNSIDVVYSNGVLHHTPNFRTAMDEAYRVLKPGGRAIIALYAKNSIQFGVIRLLGFLRGKFSRRDQDAWMGEASEGAWRTQGRMNPWTETFSAEQLREVVRKYGVRDLVLRKNGHPIMHIPRVGPGLMRSSLVRRIDRLLEPTLGDMLVMSFTK